MSRRIFSVLFILMLLFGYAIAENNSAGKRTIREVAKDGRFIVYDNGTVLDTKTNLMWAAKDNGKDIKWQEAKLYCDNYKGGGYTDWRLPRLAELEELYDEHKSQPAKCTNGNSIHFATGLIDITCLCLWASETNASTNEAAYFDFSFGVRSAIANQWSQSSRVLPVRSSEQCPTIDFLSYFKGNI